MNSNGRPIPVNDTVLAGLDLSLWSGPSADAAGMERALDWEVECSRADPGARFGFLFRVPPGCPRWFRLLLAGFAASSHGRFELVLLLRDEDWENRVAEIDPRAGQTDAGADLPGLLRALGLESRVRLAHPDKGACASLRGLAERCDFVGVGVPGTWVQPRALFALDRFLRRERTDLLTAHALELDDAGRRNAVRRVPEAPLHSSLGANPFGALPLVATERCLAALPRLESFERDLGLAPWTPWLLGLAASGTSAGRVRRLPLTPWIVSECPPCAEAGDASRFAEFVRRTAIHRGTPLAGWELAGSVHRLRAVVSPAPVRRLRLGVVIPFRDGADLTRGAIRSLAAQDLDEPPFLALVDNGSHPGLLEELVAEARDLLGRDRVFGLRDEHPFNFARLNNAGVRALPAFCSELLLLNNDVAFGRSGDLARLASLLRWPEVGLAGGTLVYPDGEIQSAGLRFGPAGPEAVRDESAGAHLFREVDAMSFACAVMRREVYEVVGGLDEEACPNGFGDALFCHRIGRRGWRILCDPGVVIRHHESKSRGSRPEEFEFFEMVREGLAVPLHAEDLASRAGVVEGRLGQPRPPLGKRVYRAWKAALKQLFPS